MLLIRLMPEVKKIRPKTKNTTNGFQSPVSSFRKRKAPYIIPITPSKVSKGPKIFFRSIVFILCYNGSKTLPIGPIIIVSWSLSRIVRDKLRCASRISEGNFLPAVAGLWPPFFSASPCALWPLNSLWWKKSHVIIHDVFWKIFMVGWMVGNLS